MDADALLASLRRRYVLITALNWLPPGIAMAVMILLMDSRGLDMGAIGAITAAYGLTTALLELPTGGLADRLSRRGVLAVSAAIGAFAFGGMAVATTAWAFALVYMLAGLARALSSGPAEAWYVDSVRAVREDADIRRGLAAAQAAGAVALGVGTVGGGALALMPLLPDQGLVTAMSGPMVVSAFLNLLLLAVVATGMSEPERSTGKVRVATLLAEVPRTVAAGVALGVRNRALMRLLLTFMPIGIGLTAVELLTPGRLLSLTGDPGTSAGAYGVVTAIGFAANAVGSALTGPLTRLLGGSAVRAAVVGSLVSAFGLAGLFATGGLDGAVGVAATGGGYALMFFGLGLRGPVHSELIHRQVDSSERATVLSVQSLLMQGGGSLAAVSLPWLAAAWSVPGAWLAVGLLIAVSTALFRKTGTPSDELHRPSQRPLEPADDTTALRP